MFGGLKGVAGDWDAVVQAYGKGNLALAECGLGIVQCTDYEVPHQRRQLSKFRQQLKDLDRREGEYAKLATVSRQRYTDECAALGIPGRRVADELEALRAELPAAFEGVTDALREGPGERALGYLEAFLAHTGVPFDAAETFPALREISDPGQDGVAAQAWARKEQEQAREATAAGVGAHPEISWDLSDGLADEDDAAAGGSPAEPAGIDWDFDVADGDEGEGTGDGEAPAPAELDVEWDLGTEGEAGADAAPAVDWDIEMEAGADAGAEVGELEVHWGVETGEDRETGAGAEGAVEAREESAGGGGGARRGVQLNDADFRGSLMDDLHELQAFLSQRVSEGAAAGPEAPPAVADETSESLGELLGWVTGVIDALGCKRTTLLLMLGRSRFMDRTVRGLEHARAQEGKYRDLLRQLEDKRREAQANIVTSAAKLDFLLKRLRTLKADAEGQISALYKSRPVNVLGKVNTVLAEA